MLLSILSLFLGNLQIGQKTLLGLRNMLIERSSAFMSTMKCEKDYPTKITDRNFRGSERVMETKCNSSECLGVRVVGTETSQAP